MTKVTKSGRRTTAARGCRTAGRTRRSRRPCRRSGPRRRSGTRGGSFRTVIHESDAPRAMNPDSTRIAATHAQEACVPWNSCSSAVGGRSPSTVRGAPVSSPGRLAKRTFSPAKTATRANVTQKTRRPGLQLGEEDLTEPEVCEPEPVSVVAGEEHQDHDQGDPGPDDTEKPLSHVHSHASRSVRPRPAASNGAFAVALSGRLADAWPPAARGVAAGVETMPLPEERTDSRRARCRSPAAACQTGDAPGAPEADRQAGIFPWSRSGSCARPGPGRGRSRGSPGAGRGAGWVACDGAGRVFRLFAILNIMR